MGFCKYCGQKAGWFSEAHEACVRRAQQGVEALKTCVADAVVHGKKWGEVAQQIAKLLADSAIPELQGSLAIKDGWNLGAIKRSIQQPISREEGAAMFAIYKEAGVIEEAGFTKEAGFTAEEMKAGFTAGMTDGFTAIAFSYLIWTVLNDQIEPYEGPIHFNFQHGEIPVFGFANVHLSEVLVATAARVSESQRVTSTYDGVYYHLGGVRGHREQSSSLKELDYGEFLMTTQAVYFGGRHHGVNFRLPYKQIIRFQPYSDAVGICKNGGRETVFAPEHVPGPECGWFLFNVLQAIAAKMQA